MAFMPIQLAADTAPNGTRHSCIAPLTRPPPPPPPPRRRAANVDSHTVRKHRTCRHSPARHGQHRRDDRPGRSGQLAAAVGPRRSQAQRLLDGGHAALAHAHPDRAGVGGQPVDVLERQAGVGHRLEAGVDGEGERVHHEPPAHARSARCRRARRRCSKRSSPSGGRGVGRTGSGTRSTGSVAPVGSNSGNQTSSCCSKRTCHLLADVDVVELAADDVRREVDARVLGERHVGDHVGRLEAGQPLVVVDGEADDGGPPRHLGRRGRAAAAGRADRRGRVDERRRSRRSPGSAGGRRRRRSRTTRWSG